MKKYRKNLILALVCFLIVIVLNFFLPRLLPGNPIAYLTGFSEEDMTPAQVAYYRQALHLDKPVFVQFGYYLRSLADGTLGYSFKKEATVSALIGQRLGYTLQITLPAVLLSTVIGLLWGLRCGYKKGSSFEKISTTFQIIVNTMPTFLIALVLLILFCFRQRWFPYTGLKYLGNVKVQIGAHTDQSFLYARDLLQLFGDDHQGNGVVVGVGFDLQTNQCRFLLIWIIFLSEIYTGQDICTGCFAKGDNIHRSRR